jgi:cell division protein WhiA
VSFTQEVKHELANAEINPCCRKAETAALIQLCASLMIQNQHLQLLIKTENATTAKRIFTLLKGQYAADMRLSVMKKMKLRKNNIYQLHVLSQAKSILEDLEVMGKEGLQSHPRKSLVRKECCARAYLAGAFLAAGSINSPKKTNYHCEIVTQDQSHAVYIQEVMNRFDLGAKYIERRHQHVIYLKASEKISDFLRLIQANNAVLDFEDVRIQRDFHNSMTRLDNCEVANNMKTMMAANEQIEAIQTLIDTGQFDGLEEKLKSVAYLRLNHPESSLIELVSLYQMKTGLPISKSGIKHRLAKLNELAKTQT